jgi:hypothetical protein
MRNTAFEFVPVGGPARVVRAASVPYLGSYANWGSQRAVASSISSVMVTMSS